MEEWCFVSFLSFDSKQSRQRKRLTQHKRHCIEYSSIVGGMAFRFFGFPQRSDMGWAATEWRTFKRCRTKVILLSGATGCIGRQIWLNLMHHTQHRVKLIVRKDSLSKLDSNIWKKYSRRTQVLFTDLNDLRGLKSHLRDIDCAILTATSWGGEQVFSVNVDSTLQLIQWLPKDCHVLYFSTASIIDSHGCLLEEAYRYGTPYLQSKYVALQRLLLENTCRRITVIFPTLVVGPHSHLANVTTQITTWKGLLQLVDVDASAHFIHAIDAAKVITYLMDFYPKTLFYTWHPSDPQRKLPAFVLGQPYFTADQLIQSVCRKKRFLSIPRIPILSLFPPFLISRLLLLLGATVDPWVLYCLRKRHFVYSHAVAPENFGLVSQWRHISQLFSVQE
ncbi:hypothetical protein GpartN1_g7301.t1 [Galdieria partita]|uniref:NAD-dependent epimerase/dehydratase domain-containing protein n=1 Tax=Galdieria partita TaxID=83374 RepID=A0A9C7Q477_9RHOD|nr:hypothetical protein GpartN1_g7301.t1 [Galdieria partita]